MFCRRCYRNRGYYRNNQQNEISFNELKDKVSKGAILIDVRSPQEYNEGHLPEALNIPEYEIRKVKNEMTIFGLSLATVQDKDDKNYWNRVFKTTENVVQKSNGNNYMDTVINKQSGAATMYDIKPSSSPYKIGE